MARAMTQELTQRAQNLQGMFYELVDAAAEQQGLVFDYENFDKPVIRTPKNQVDLDDDEARKAAAGIKQESDEEDDDNKDKAPAKANGKDTGATT